MKLSVEFPSVSYREGPAAVAGLARAIERIGYDHIDIFDHVVMGVPIEGRARGPYNAAMPILEALMALSYIAAVTTRVTLGTEVLVLPQRQPTLVAKQVSTLDTLSGGRVRLGVGARPSRPSTGTPRRPGAIPGPSGCRAWWRRRRATRRARPSMPTTTRWWPASPPSRPWASAGWP